MALVCMICPPTTMDPTGSSVRVSKYVPVTAAIGKSRRTILLNDSPRRLPEGVPIVTRRVGSRRSQVITYTSAPATRRLSRDTLSPLEAVWIATSNEAAHARMVSRVNGERWFHIFRTSF